MWEACKPTHHQRAEGLPCVRASCITVFTMCLIATLIVHDWAILTPSVYRDLVQSIHKVFKILLLCFGTSLEQM